MSLFVDQTTPLVRPPQYNPEKSTKERLMTPDTLTPEAMMELVQTNMNVVSVSYTHLTLPTTPYV